MKGSMTSQMVAVELLIIWKYTVGMDYSLHLMSKISSSTKGGLGSHGTMGNMGEHGDSPNSTNSTPHKIGIMILVKPLTASTGIP